MGAFVPTEQRSPARRLPAGRRAARGAPLRERNARVTRHAILLAAIDVFSRRGFDGGRIEQISKAARSCDRMIYYYFGSKERLYVEVLEETYRRFVQAGARIESTLDADKPAEALQRLVDFVCGYFRSHPEFISLLNNENLHQGRHVSRSTSIRNFSPPAIGLLARILQRGVEQGLFRADVPARDAYLMIASMAYFHVSHRHTLSAFLGEPMGEEAAAQWQAFVTAALMRTLAAGTGGDAVGQPDSSAQEGGSARIRRAGLPA